MLLAPIIGALISNLCQRMAHARKMVLVPHENIEKLNSAGISPGNEDLEQVISALAHQYLPTSQTPGTPATRLDAELKSILNSESPKDDGEKLKLYNEVLRRYLFHSIKPGAPFSAREQPATTENGYKTDSIVNAVPKTYQQTASKLLQHIQTVDGGQRLKWDSQGRVTLDGNTISGSNIVDLVNDALRHRKRVKATGRVDFARFLQEINTPREFVGNNSFLAAQGTSARHVASTPIRQTAEFDPVLADESTLQYGTPNTSWKRRHASRSLDESNKKLKWSTRLIDFD